MTDPCKGGFLREFPPQPYLSIASLEAAPEHCAGNSFTQQACGTCAASGRDSKWESRLPQVQGPDTHTSNAFILGLHCQLASWL